MRTTLALLLLLLAVCARENRQTRKIVLVPIGPVPADLLAHLQRELPPIVKGDVLIAAGIAPPAAALDPSRQQYRGSVLLEELERQKIEGDRVVGIIDADAYAPGLNFIFGQAKKPGRVGVVALPRLRQSFFGRPENPALFRERALKTTVHELGHTFGFPHCPDSKCVMHFANSIGDTDHQGFQYCDRERLPD